MEAVDEIGIGQLGARPRLGGGEIEPHDRAFVQHIERHAHRFGLGLQRRLQPVGLGVHAVDAVLGQMLDREAAGDARQHIAVEGAAVIEPLAAAGGIGHVHDLRPAAHRAGRHAAAHEFAEEGEVGR